MFTRIDHLMIGVPDLAQATAQYTKLGFDVQPGGVHPGKGTHNAITFNQEDYIELIAVRDAAEYASGRSALDAGLPGFVAAGGGIRYVILQSNDLVADVAAMRNRGIEVSDAVDGARRTPEGRELRWKVAQLGPRNPLPLFFIEHVTPLAERRTGFNANPNGVYKIERAYIASHDAAADAALYAKVLGMPLPKQERGTVIMADMFVFQLGNSGLGIAQPYAPGVAADSLERRGPGPFQALYRTTSMGAAARWMQEHGMPPPARGVRNTGEQAMLVTPADAYGAYIGFVGPQ